MSSERTSSPPQSLAAISRTRKVAPKRSSLPPSLGIYALQYAPTAICLWLWGKSNMAMVTYSDVYNINIIAAGTIYSVRNAP